MSDGICHDARVVMLSDELSKTIKRHSHAPEWSVWRDRIGCEACAHLNALRVERSFTQYQCGCSQCKDYLNWNLRGESRSECACFIRCTHEQFEHMADCWSASAEALRRLFKRP